jgi:hypothetical protein
MDIFCGAPARSHGRRLVASSFRARILYSRARIESTPRRPPPFTSRAGDLQAEPEGGGSATEPIEQCDSPPPPTHSSSRRSSPHKYVARTRPTVAKHLAGQLAESARPIGGNNHDRRRGDRSRRYAGTHTGQRDRQGQKWGPPSTGAQVQRAGAAAVLWPGRRWARGGRPPSGHIYGEQAQPAGRPAAPTSHTHDRLDGRRPSVAPGPSAGDR